MSRNPKTSFSLRLIPQKGFCSEDEQKSLASGPLSCHEQKGGCGKQAGFLLMAPTWRSRGGQHASLQQALAVRLRCQPIAPPCGRRSGLVALLALLTRLPRAHRYSRRCFI